MGQGDSRFMTHVANGYDRDIRACVKANRIEVYEERMATKANIGLNDIAAGVSHNTHQKKNYVTQDPGFTTIKPGGFFGFAESGPDGHVFVTIQIGSEIPHANVQVYNDTNVLVDNQGSLRNVKYKKIWTDTSGQKHNTPAPAQEGINPVKKEEKVQVKASEEKQEEEISPAKEKEKLQVKGSKEKQEVQKQSKKKSKENDKDTLEDSDTDEDEQTNESEDSDEECDMESTGEEWQSGFELVDTKIISLATGLFSKALDRAAENKGNEEPKKKSKDIGKSGKMLEELLETQSDDSDEDIFINGETSAEELQQEVSFADNNFFSLARRLLSKDADKEHKGKVEPKKKSKDNGKSGKGSSKDSTEAEDPQDVSPEDNEDESSMDSNFGEDAQETS